MSYFQSPDMIAFTIGKVTLSLMRSDDAISGNAIKIALHKIAKGHISDRISKEMAQGALAVIGEHA